MELAVSVLLGLLGLALGSFLLTVVDRHHAGRSWVKGRSQCEHCKRQLTWWELVPLMGFIILRGRCRSCKKRIAGWHLVAELLLAGLFIAVYLAPFALGRTSLVAHLIIVSALFTLFLYDIKYGELPDQLTVPMLVLALGWVVFSGGDWVPALAAAALGGGFFLVQWLVSGGTWVGSGDSRLGALIGLLVGWPYIIAVLFIAYVGGSLIALVLLALKIKSAKDRLPMGAFLVPATLLVLWLGPWIVARALP